MLHNLHIVVADLEGGEVASLYLGTDAAAANEAFEKADVKCEAARLFSFPAATRLRYPSQEAIDIQRRSAASAAGNAEAIRKAQSELNANAARLKEHEARHARLSAELSALKGDKPDPKPKTESEPAKRKGKK